MENLLAESMNEIKRLHEQLLYPIVRIRALSAAGSGTIIYSEPDPKNEGDYLTFILTNHHVIDDLIKVRENWSNLLKRMVKTEFMDEAQVEVFEYVSMSKVDSNKAYRAQILGYDKQHDLAVLQLETPKQLPYVAKLIPRDQIKNLRLFMDIGVSGCSLAHEPFVNFGEITFLGETIDQKRYTMYNAGSYFGNSGGGLFLTKTGWLIGVPSRISAQQLGFSVDIVPFMGFGAAPERLYEFFDEQEFKFLYDQTDDYYSAAARREARQKRSLLEMKAEMIRREEEDSE